MWPFKTKDQAVPVPMDPIALQVKSLSAPEAQPRWRLFARRQEKWDVKKAINEGYNESTIVYACIEKRAKLIASVPWVVKRRNRDGDWEEVENHPLQRLLENPNPDQSFYELMYHASQSLDVAGNSFISKIRAGTRGQPTQLWHLPPQHIKIKPGTERLVEYYEYADHAIKGRRIDASDMIQLRLPNPDSPIFGMPTLKAAGRSTDVDRESAIWQKTSLENRGSADVNIKLPENTSQEQADIVKKSYQDQQAGAKNARRAFISNAEIQQLGQTAVEMDFVASRRAVWTEIAAAFGMSLANLGMTEAVNLANAEAMEKSLWQNTIVPMLELLQRQLNHHLAKDFGADVALSYDLSNVTALQEGQGEKLDSAQKLFNMGVPFNVISQHLELGIEEIPGGDVGYLAGNLLPAGFDPGGDDLAEDDPPPDDEATE